MCEREVVKVIRQALVVGWDERYEGSEGEQDEALAALDSLEVETARYREALEQIAEGRVPVRFTGHPLPMDYRRTARAALTEEGR